MAKNPGLENNLARDEGNDEYSKCSMAEYVFGVKSYLHHFYEPNDKYEDDGDRLYGIRNKRRCVTSVWWKIFVWIGVNLLVFGIIGVCIGYLVPPKQILMGNVANDVEMIDTGAIGYNLNLDVCKLVGLVLFCSGGFVLAVALLLPSFMDCFVEENAYSYITISHEDTNNDIWFGAVDSSRPVPSSSVLKEVQPTRKPQESTYGANSELTKS